MCDNPVSAVPAIRRLQIEHIIRRLDPTNVDHAVKLYQSGKTIAECAAVTNVSKSVIGRALKARDIACRSRRTPEPPNLIADYAAGESVKSLALRHGIERSAVNRMLSEAGIAHRNRSEAMYTRMAGTTREERLALTEAAHTAVRGRVATEAERIKIAATKHGRTYSASETLLAQLLSLVDVESELGVACGRYNIDILAGDTVAVEVFGGHWHASGRHAERFPRRSRYILDQGYSLVIVWVHEQRYPLGLKCAQHIATLVEIARSTPSGPRQYWVIRGDGELLSTLQDDGNEVPLILPHGRRANSGT
jgi:flagellar motor switch/type III secretory pathway protein FliN